MKRYNLIDTDFVTNIMKDGIEVYIFQDSTAPGLKSERLEWVREVELELDTFYSNASVIRGARLNGDKKRYGIILESQAIIPQVYYSIIHSYPQDIDIIFTHSSQLLNMYPDRTKWIPGGSIWIGGSYGGGEIKIYDKTKNCSMVSSDKRMCPLHLTRISIAEFLPTFTKDVDIYGTVKGQWVQIIETLRDYRFSICMENYVDEAYFTEKILNCFATGTVPIYLGAKRIGDFFNPDGILQFTNPKELMEILVDKATESEYNKMLPAIKDNFERCKKFRLMEDYLVDTYL